MSKALYLERKVAGLCTRCSEPADEDSGLCAVCRKARNQASAKSMQRRRKARRADKRCIYCGEHVPSGDYACPNCRLRINRYQQQWLEQANVNRVVNPNDDRSQRLAQATRTHADGRTRYHGQQKRGNQPHAQLDAQDLRFARREFDAGEAGLRLLESPEVKQLPRIQRDDVKAAALHQLGRCQGHIEDVLERRGHFKVRHGKRDGE